MTDKAYRAYLESRNLTADGYTFMEMLAVSVSREIPDGSFAFVGTGLPLLAAGLAQRTHAPEMTIILEAGTVGPRMEHLPVSVADPRAALGAATLSSLVDAFGTIACRGYCTIGVLGAAECDKYGNLNSTGLGGYWPAGVSEDGKGPRSRFTGSGGANDIASLADKVVAMMVHEKRRFPERVQYLTSPAGMRGPSGEDRYDCGRYRGGDVCVITDLCKMRPNPGTGVLEVTEVFPGSGGAGEIAERTGWDVCFRGKETIAPPTEEELRVLRMEVDPGRLYLGREKKG